MKEVLPQEPNVVDSGIEPTQTTAGSSAIPMAQAIAKAAQVHKEDPWITLIERLWEANPYSDWVPVDVGEILSVSRLIWLDTLRHPLRLWTTLQRLCATVYSGDDQQRSHLVGTGRGAQTGHRARGR